MIREDENSYVIAIYIKGHYFKDFFNWSETVAGKKIMKIFNKKKYSNYLKCVYFDNITLLNEDMELVVRQNTMECIINWTINLDEPENVKCFTICQNCSKFCTVKFYFDQTPMCCKFSKKCVEC